MGGAIGTVGISVLLMMTGIENRQAYAIPAMLLASFGSVFLYFGGNVVKSPVFKIAMAFIGCLILWRIADQFQKDVEIRQGITVIGYFMTLFGCRIIHG